jgi:hypothetical protein
MLALLNTYIVLMTLPHSPLRLKLVVRFLAMLAASAAVFPISRAAR